MRRSPALTPFVIAALVIAAMSGCLPSDPAPVRPLEPTAVPLFASDEGALAAAEEAYTKYLAASDQIAQEGGANPERLADYVTDDWLLEEADAFTRLADTGRRQVGTTLLRRAEMQRYDVASSGDEVVIYACVDFGSSYFVDAQGAVVTPPEQSTLVTFEIQLVAVQDRLLIAGSELWESESVC